MVDFSYHRDDILGISGPCTASLQILDHHITAQSALGRLAVCLFRYGSEWCGTRLGMGSYATYPVVVAICAGQRFMALAPSP